MTTYYIAPTGNDSTGDGSTGTPWLTIAKFHASCANGDTLRCKDGLYRQSDTATITKTNLIIENDVGAVPIFTLSAEYLTWGKTSGRTNVYETAYTAPRCDSAWNDATPLVLVADVATVDATTNSYYWDDAGNLLYVNIGGAAPSAIQATRYPFGITDSTALATGLVVRGLTVKWNCWGFNVAGANTTIEACNITANGLGYGGSAVRVAAASSIVRGCVCIGRPRTVTSFANVIDILAGSSTALIEDCTISDGGYGIQIATGTGHVVRNNTIKRQYGCGVLWKAAASGEMYGNRLVDPRHGGTRGDVAHSGTVYLHHNLFYLTDADNPTNDGLNGSMAAFHTHGAGSTWYVYNNIFAWNDKAAGAQGYGCVIWPDPDPAIITVTIRNNIFYHCYLAINISDNEAGVGTTVFASPIDYNAFYIYANAYVKNVAVGDVGTHNIVDIDPRFCDPGKPNNPDFRLLPDSPCINAGTLVVGVSEGFRGSAPDIGAYEYVRPVRHGRR